MNNKILQILDITTVSVDTNLFNITAINRNSDPYWAEFAEPFLNELQVEIKILPLNKIDLRKKWIINVDINMWNWDTYEDDLFGGFDDLIMNELRYGNAYIILNHQCESHTRSFFRMFYRKKITIPYSKIIYMVAAADAEQEYKTFVMEYDIKKERQIKIFYVHHVYKRFKHDVNIESFLYAPAKKIKKYLSLNRRWRDHRVMLVSMLSHRNLLQDGFVSLGIMPEEAEKAQMGLQDIDLIAGYLKFKNQLPLQVDDIDLSINQFQMNSLPMRFYQLSYFSLVSSTMALRRDEESVGFTEKEIKPILAKHPFIIWNRPGVLRHLKNMGFLTFEPWFNESYDDEPNDFDRMVKIVDEVQRLCKLSNNEWDIMINEMQPVLNHNFNRMVNYTNEHCYFNSDLKKLLYYVD